MPFENPWPLGIRAGFGLFIIPISPGYSTQFSSFLGHFLWVPLFYPFSAFQSDLLHLKPLIASPNAGLPQIIDGRETYNAGPEQFVEHVGGWIQKGARIVSGCCGSTPLHLKKMAEKVRELSQNWPSF